MYLHWCYLFQYRHANLAKQDIINAMTHYTDLRPKLDTFGKLRWKLWV